MNKYLVISIIIFLSIMCLMGITGSETVKAQPLSDSKEIQAAKSGPDLIAEDIVIRKRGDMNFRVRVKNIGDEAARGLMGKLQVSLSVRDKDSGEWVLLKKWENIDKILPGQTVSRDYFASSGEANPNLKEESYTLKAEISFKTSTGIKISKESVTKSYPEDAVENP